MSAQHRQWVEEQADAIEYQRQMRELDAYANPYHVRRACRASIINERRLIRDLDRLAKGKK